MDKNCDERVHQKESCVIIEAMERRHNENSDEKDVCENVVSVVQLVMADEDAIFDENRFSSVPRPSLKIPIETEDIGSSVVPEEFTKEVVYQPKPELKKSKKNKTPKDFGPKFHIYLFERTKDEVSDQHSYCFTVEDGPKTFDKAMKSHDVSFWKKAIKDKMDSIMGNNTWCWLIYLQVANLLVTNGSSKEKCRPDIAFRMGKLSRYTSNHVLEDYLDASWISNNEDISSTSGWVFVLGGGAISWASKKQPCITGSIIESGFMALVATGKEAECAATLAKAYSQMHNENSRHLGVRYSMIRELITNGLISIEFVRSQQNLADQLMKELARDLIIKSAKGMRLKSNKVAEWMSLKATISTSCRNDIAGQGSNDFHGDKRFHGDTRFKLYTYDNLQKVDSYQLDAVEKYIRFSLKDSSVKEINCVQLGIVNQAKL
nr:zinc finger, CCHC-type [Tanacetum cinerariifolium]